MLFTQDPIQDQSIMLTTQADNNTSEYHNPFLGKEETERMSVGQIRCIF